MQPSQPSVQSEWPLIHGLLFFTLAAATSLISAFQIWPLPCLVPLGGYAVLVTTVAPLRRSFRPWRAGRVDLVAAVAAFILGAGASAVLLAFDRLERPDVSFYADFLLVSTLGGVMSAGIIFSLLNALFEEVVFRGILFDAVESQWGRWVAVFVTSCLFGYCHLRGYPSGPLGGVLACFFAFGLGWLRVFTGGLLLPVLAHVVADATIFVILARSGVFGK